MNELLDKAMEIGTVACYAVWAFFGGLWILSQGFFWETWVSFTYIVMALIVAGIVAHVATLIATYWYFRPGRH